MNTQHSRWSGWITQKFEDFRSARAGNAGSVTAFAQQFGASHSVVLGWMRPGADPPRKAAYITRLIELYGAEAYQALGLPAPREKSPGQVLSGNELRVLDLLGQVPENFQEDALNQLENFLLRHGFRRVQ